MVQNRNMLIKILQPFYVVFFYLFLYLPIAVLVIFSFNDSAISVNWSGFSLRWYQKLFSTPEIVEALIASLTVAFSATVISVFMGTALVFASKWWKPRYLFSMFYANIVFPEIIIAIGLLGLFSFFKIPLGYGSLIVGHTLIGLGFVIPIVRARFLELDPWLTEASADLGATPLQTFKKITIPLLMPSLIASSLLVFTLSLDDFFIAFFCSGPTIETLSLYVYARVKESMDPTINVIATCLLVVSSLFILILSSLKVIDQVIGHE